MKKVIVAYLLGALLLAFAFSVVWWFFAPAAATLAGPLGENPQVKLQVYAFICMAAATGNAMTMNRMFDTIEQKTWLWCWPILMIPMLDLLLKAYGVPAEPVYPVMGGIAALVMLLLLKLWSWLMTAKTQRLDQEGDTG